MRMAVIHYQSWMNVILSLQGLVGHLHVLYAVFPTYSNLQITNYSTLGYMKYNHFELCPNFDPNLTTSP